MVCAVSLCNYTAINVVYYFCWKVANDWFQVPQSYMLFIQEWRVRVKAKW